MSHQFAPSILREYDIRGVFGETLGAEDARAVGRSFGTRLIREGGRKVVVGYDGRVSSPMLEHALVEGLCASGVDVIRIGLGPSPMLYFAEASAEDADGGIQVTGSHNPANHNGFKIVLGGRPFFGSDIEDLGRIAAEGDWLSGSGTVETREVMGAYVERLLDALEGLDRRKLAAARIGWDAGNGAAGPVIDQLTARLPGEHFLLFTEVDGHFPNHHPDPTIEENLSDLRALVAAKNLDFGCAFDGDGDRIGVVDSLGRVIWGDQLLALYAEDLLRRDPNALVVVDIKSSSAVIERIRALGGRPDLWKSGHSQIKSRMKQLDAPLGGEMSGHVFFADEWYGFDDALYAALRLLAASVRLGKSVTQMRDGMPALHNTPELRFPVEEARKFAVVEEVARRLAAKGASVNRIDGVRVDTADGWWLLRASNTQAVLVARAESATAEGLVRLLAEVDAELALSGVARS